MKLTLLIILSLLTIQSLSAGTISLDAIDGSWDDAGTTYIKPNKPVNFYIRIHNDNNVVLDGLSNGFRIYGPTSFTPLVGDTILPGFAANFDLIFAINSFSIDGLGADTVGFGGSRMTGTGFVAGFNDVPYKLSTGNVAEGETLCLDSSFYPPSGTWKWANTSLEDFPSWDGPHCFESKSPPCTPPEITNAPVALSGSHCDAISFDFDSDKSGTIWSSNIGTINSNGVWSYAPTLADVGQSIVLTITATDGCGDSKNINLTFTNEAPVITCPNSTDISMFSETTFIVSATDDCDVVSFSIGSLINATAIVESDTILITTDNPGAYSVEVIANDGKASSSCFITGTAIPGPLYQAEIGCIGDQSSEFVYQGQHVEVPVSFRNSMEIGGYDMLISYDNSVLVFQSATISAEYLNCQWEYFTYRNGPGGNCGSACPSGLVRIVAIAETNNGPNHPDCFTTNGNLFTMDFLVSNDRTFECQQIPIRFFWMDCGDNAISSVDGNTLHIAEKVYDGDPVLFPPFGQEIQDFNVGYPTMFGAQDEDCFTDPLKTPIRDIAFNNGCIFIACADSIDARGDINLNNVSNEIADAVLLSNYFVYGLGVFNVNVEGQIAATDVNADGLTLSVADLVYMIRIILGDVQPYNKLTPVEMTLQNYNNILSIDDEVGALFVQYDGQADVELLASQMDIKSEYDSELDITRVLIYSIDGNSFNGQILESESKLLSVELATPQGAVVYSKLTPSEFSLSQNYPNPFNPSTTIEFSLSVSDNVLLTIYNINGQQVAQFDGNYDAGVHTFEWDASLVSSGIYFYKLETSYFSSTKKMVLLK